MPQAVAPVKRPVETAELLPLPDGTRKSKKPKASEKAFEQPVASSSKQHAAKAAALPEHSDDEDDEAEDGEDGDDDEEPDSDAVSELLHESLKPKKDKGKKKASRAKYVPEGETQADRDRRTVFIGNLPLECAKSKVSQVFLPLRGA